MLLVDASRPTKLDINEIADYINQLIILWHNGASLFIVNKLHLGSSSMDVKFADTIVISSSEI